MLAFVFPPSDSHHCLANSRSFWWCSSAFSVSPRSIKALPMQLCRAPINSFLLGASFSGHACTVFMSSLAFLRLPAAFPATNSETEEEWNYPVELRRRKAPSWTFIWIYLHRCRPGSSAETQRVPGLCYISVLPPPCSFSPSRLQVSPGTTAQCTSPGTTASSEWRPAAAPRSSFCLLPNLRIIV